MADAQAMAVPAARASGRRLLLLTNGSRGDVQPFVALGMALQRAGFAVRISTNANHVPFLQSMGLDATGTNPDSEAWLRDDPRMRECMAKGNIMECIRGVSDFNRRNFPEVFARKLQDVRAWRPDVIISTPLELCEAKAIAGAEGGIPVIASGLQAIYPSREQKSMFGEPDWFPHLALGTAFMYLFWRSDDTSKTPVILEQLPEAEPFLATSFRQFMYHFHHPISPNIIGFSPTLLRVFADWPEDLKSRVSVTGFWTVPRQEQEARLQAGDGMFGGGVRAELEAFLAKGEPPVYMGWGSMLAISPEHMACLAVRTLMQTGLRGIILGGWAGLEPKLLEGQPDSDAMAAYVREKVLFVPTAPHEWLFPQCAAIVHHGGSGTTAAALRSGVPTVITPCAFDQFDNGRMVAAGGSGIATRQFFKVTVADLASAVKRCTTDKAMMQKARTLAEKLQSEDGPGNAIKAIDDFIVQELDTGKWKANFAVQCQNTKRLKAQRPPSWLAWCARVCCSPVPNDYSVKPAKKTSKRPDVAVLLGHEQFARSAGKMIKA